MYNLTGLRAMPIYLLLDCSAGMSGEPIESIRQWVRDLRDDFRTDPCTLEILYLSVIQFGNGAKVQCPLTGLLDFQEPGLIPGGVPNMGAALRLLEKSLATDVRRTSEFEKGDYSPIVFLIAGQEPSDNWSEVADRLRREKFEVFCAAGVPNVIPVLRRITGDVVRLDKITRSTMKTFSETVRSAFWAMMREREIRGSLSTHAAAMRPPFVWNLPERISQ